MTQNRSTIRCKCRPLSLALLCAVVAAAATAGEVPLRSYAASYVVSVGERRIGVAEIRLETSEGAWQFSSLSKAQGFYALLTGRQPSTHTRFRADADGLRLLDIRIGDAGEARVRETARFDWREGRLEVERKGRQRRLELDDDDTVHDFLSIHWLAAELALSDRDSARFRLYRKGRLLASHLEYRGIETITAAGRQIEARVYEHAIAGKSTRLRYHYSVDNPLLPLRIERDDGDDVTAMTLAGVDWDL